MLKLKPRKTVDDYMRLPEETRAELIEGELFMTPSPKSDHQRIGRELGHALWAFVKSRGLGEVFNTPLDIHLPSGDVVQPDLIFIRAGRLEIVRDWIRGVPDMIVEIVSTDRPERDRIVKRDLYARNGVPEYWIVDPEAGSIEVLALEAGHYVSRGYFETADSLDSPSLPGFSPPLKSVFENLPSGRSLKSDS